MYQILKGENILKNNVGIHLISSEIPTFYFLGKNDILKGYLPPILEGGRLPLSRRSLLWGVL